MKIRGLALLAAALSSAGGAEPAAKPPTGKWYVDFGEAQCMATRNYGTADNPLYLVLKAPPIGDVLQIGIARKGYIPDAVQLDGEVVFDDGPPIRANLLEFGVKNLNQHVLLVNLPRSELASMKQATSIRLRARNSRQVIGSRLAVSDWYTDQRLQLAAMSQLLQTLDSCASGLRRTWNVEEENAPVSLLKVKPTGNLPAIFSDDDYPAVAAFKRQAGSLKLAVLIKEDGTVGDCTVTKTSGVASLDAQSCAIIMQRAKFTPAIGVDGKPAKSAILQTIEYQLVR